jgi:hypothetical protein
MLLLIMKIKTATELFHVRQRVRSKTRRTWADQGYY